MKKLLVFLLICITLVSGCGSASNQNTESVSSNDITENYTLIENQVYTVLDVREIEQTQYHYGGSLASHGERLLNLVVESKETGERYYVVFSCKDTDNLSNNYINMAKLVVGDTFKYTSNYTYELLN